MGRLTRTLVKLMRFGPVRGTRFPELAYQRQGECWRFLDLESESGEAPIGGFYPSREALLADLERFARLWGYT